MFRSSTCASVGGMLYPWWRWMMSKGDCSSSHPSSWPMRVRTGNIKPDLIRPQSSRCHSTIERCRVVYRGFRRMLRCLTLDAAVARPAVNGSHPVQFGPLCL